MNFLINIRHTAIFTVREVSKYGIFFWSVFSPNAGKYGPEKTSYMNTFHAVFVRNNYNRINSC